MVLQGLKKRYNRRWPQLYVKFSSKNSTEGGNGLGPRFSRVVVRLWEEIVSIVRESNQDARNCISKGREIDRVLSAKQSTVRDGQTWHPFRRACDDA